MLYIVNMVLCTYILYIQSNKLSNNRWICSDVYKLDDTDCEKIGFLDKHIQVYMPKNVKKNQQPRIFKGFLLSTEAIYKKKMYNQRMEHSTQPLNIYDCMHVIICWMWSSGYLINLWHITQSISKSAMYPYIKNPKNI